MRSAIKLFLVLVSSIVILFAWITDQFENPKIKLLAYILIAATLSAFLIITLLDYRDKRKQRREHESQSGSRISGK